MKTTSAISIYLSFTLFNHTLAADKQNIQFTGSLFYGVSEKYSMHIIKQIPAAFAISNHKDLKIYTLEI